MLPRAPGRLDRHHVSGHSAQSDQAGQSSLEYAATLGVAALLIIMVGLAAYLGYLS